LADYLVDEIRKLFSEAGHVRDWTVLPNEDNNLADAFSDRLANRRV
jgi:hypothetical protein